MPDQEPNQAPAVEPQSQTENQDAPKVSSDISSLRNFRERQAATSTAAKATPGEGAASPGQAAGDNREQFIPRTRFDEVLAERNAERERAQQAMQLLAQYQAQLPAHATAQVPQPYAQPQPLAPTGMVGAQATPPAHATAQVPDFSDPAVQKQWRDKIANNPVTGLKEFVSLLIRAEGEPLLNQYQQQVLSQLAPIQQTFVQQQLGAYEQSRAQADPSFAQVKDHFRNLTARAVQMGHALTPEALSVIEQVARQQLGVPVNYQAPAQPSFSERPGGASDMARPQAPQLTEQQRAVARRFNMTDAEYASFLTANGVAR